MAYLPVGFAFLFSGSVWAGKGACLDRKWGRLTKALSGIMWKGSRVGWQKGFNELAAWVLNPALLLAGYII